MPAPFVLALAGTRPEVIKLAPVLSALEARGLRVALGVTGQHRDLLARALLDCGLRPEFDLELMEPAQGLPELLGRIVAGLAEPLRRLAPHAVLVQGDTTSALGGALAASLLGFPVGHVEAGLRSGDPALPFPEERQRRLIADLATWHFAPSERGRAALLAEGIASSAIHLTGNPVIDACQALRGAPPPELVARGALVLVTLHRRELWEVEPRRGAAVLGALRHLAAARPDLTWVFPAHPRVRALAERACGDLPNFAVCDPLPYPAFLGLLAAARFALSDSGGVQEEGPALGTPVLVVRDKTERPEALAPGAARLVGTEPAGILAAVEELLADPAPRRAHLPYGAGGAAAAIADVLAAALDSLGSGAPA